MSAGGAANMSEIEGGDKRRSVGGQRSAELGASNCGGFWRRHRARQ
jgi:hypothetical protein